MFFKFANSSLSSSCLEKRAATPWSDQRDKCYLGNKVTRRYRSQDGIKEAKSHKAISFVTLTPYRRRSLQFEPQYLMQHFPGTLPLDCCI